MESILKIRFKEINRSGFFLLLKWSLMASGIFWMVVFRLSEQGLKLPDFVYVNF